MQKKSGAWEGKERRKHLRKGVWLVREEAGYDPPWSETNVHNTYLINEENKYIGNSDFVRNGAQWFGYYGYNGGITSFESANNYSYMANDFAPSYWVTSDCFGPQIGNSVLCRIRVPLVAKILDSFAKRFSTGCGL
jgi:hypothetical protein